MATHKQVVGTRTSLAYSATLTTLAATNYVRNTTAYDCTVNQPADVVVEVSATNGASTGQLIVFIQESLDGTNFRTGPTASTTNAASEPVLKWLGSLPLPVNSTAQLATFSVAQALGYVPAKFYIVLKNDTGAALSAGAVYTSEITNTMT